MLWGVYYLTNKPVTPTFFPSITQINSNDHITWSIEKKNILIEYTDYQCPACKNFHDYIKSNLATDKNITEKITFVSRNFPLYQIHKDAFLSGYSVEAAGRQDKFFEMADQLFATQSDWADKPNPQAYFLKLAEKLRLNTDQFRKDMVSQEIKNKVDNDLKTGESVGIDSTPTFFLNGYKLQFSTFDEFKQALLNPPSVK